MSQINIDTIADRAGTISTPAEDVIRGSARAFVNFNGTGTVAIRASYNVSSITDNGAGDYTVNFTNAMPDANYSTTALSSLTGSRVSYNSDTPQTVSGLGLRTTPVGSGTSIDSPNVSVTVFR